MKTLDYQIHEVENGVRQEESPNLLEMLDACLMHDVMLYLEPKEVCTMAVVAREARKHAESPMIWNHFLSSRCHRVLRHLPSPAADSSSQMQDEGLEGRLMRKLFFRARPLEELQTAQWRHITLSLTPRASYSTCIVPWRCHDDSCALLWGGWGGGMRNDLWLLENVSSSATRWRRLHPSGPTPQARYGHTATLVGKDKDMLFVYGGLLWGGYGGETDQCSLLQRRKGEDDDDEEEEYVWTVPRIKGDETGPRGYHAACASEDGTKVFIFGGMDEAYNSNTLIMIDTETWTCTGLNNTTGDLPSPRFGCSLTHYKGSLYLIGGGQGRALAQTGCDLEDVHSLDLSTRHWTDLTTSIKGQSPGRKYLGRCHCASLIGSKVILFGGSMALGSALHWLDLDALSWGRVGVNEDKRPMPRMSASMILLGTELLLYGGWTYIRDPSDGSVVRSRELFDLHRAKLTDFDALIEPEMGRDPQEDVYPAYLLVNEEEEEEGEEDEEEEGEEEEDDDENESDEDMEELNTSEESEEEEEDEEWVPLM